MAPNACSSAKNSSMTSRNIKDGNGVGITSTTSSIGRLRHGHSKSLTNLYNPSPKSVSSGTENFILSNGVHRNGILRRALVAAREGDLNTLQVKHG